MILDKVQPGNQWTSNYQDEPTGKGKVWLTISNKILAGGKPG
jgi:hypothetical protein